MQHCYDFYKPDMASEYPTVDGKLSIKCYFTALDKCYQLYKEKFARQQQTNLQTTTISDFDYMIFHTPFCKIVQKSFGRLMLHDLLDLEDDLDSNMQEKYKELIKYRYAHLVYSNTMFNLLYRD